jgi:hypothetical protein
MCCEERQLPHQTLANKSFWAAGGMASQSLCAAGVNGLRVMASFPKVQSDTQPVNMRLCRGRQLSYFSGVASHWVAVGFGTPNVATRPFEFAFSSKGSSR